jgi:peptide/nickel transport system substrate-binding protein
MENKNTYIIIAIVIVIALIGGYFVLTPTSTPTPTPTPTPVVTEREAKWKDWSETIYIGVTGYEFHPDGFDIGTDSSTEIYRHLCAPRLLWVDGTKLGQYNCHVAESWTKKTDEDGDVYVEFKLKPGLTFRDGTPINAEAVVWAWKRGLYDLPYRTQNSAWNHQWTMEETWAASPKGLVVEDDLTLRMYCNPAWPNFDPFWKHFLFGVEIGFLFSPTLGEQYGKENSSLEDYAIIGKHGGYGPFYLESWVPNERYTLVADEDFPVNPLGGMAGPSYSEHIKKVVVIGYEDTASIRMALEAQEIDIIYVGSLARADIPTLSENPGIKVTIVPYVGFGNQLHMNFAPEFYPLNVTKVRQAIQYAVDPQEIIDKLTFGTATISHSPVRPGMDFYKPELESIRALPMDERIQIAKDLLAEAGFPDGFTTQFWYATGVGTEAFNRDIGTILQAQLAKIGITLELKFTESGIYYDMVEAGKLPMFTRGWTLDYPDPDTELMYMMQSTCPDLAMRINFNDSHIDEILTEGRAIYGTGQEERREEIYTELQDLIVERGFSVPLYLDGFWWAQNDYVEDYRPWMTCDRVGQGIWNIKKVIPSGWETRDPPN